MSDLLDALILSAFAFIGVMLPVAVWLRYRTGLAMWLAAAISFVYIAGVNAIAGSPQWILNMLRISSIICATVYLVMVLWIEYHERRQEV